ncbi:MAG: glycosyltransferase [Sulfuricurvum sp.]|uniref:glycosyltransferase n=1 Tax=Sulfuricurvum sp. TaxID=2025608 RepID=UPI00262E7434|nr:glycosyltransferase [Sulfuricurvum sp.]MDD2829596.1 glycosyltransferase [Sulfuricurvum sp.]MDD4950528.1 glycosyltransferase [Sulfuricurvum sp.]
MMLILLKEELSKNPLNHGTNVKLAQFYLHELKEYDNAIIYFENARAIRQDVPGPLQGLINAYKQSGNSEKAFFLVEDARKKFPNHLGFNNLYIAILMDMGRLHDAIIFLESLNDNTAFSFRLARLYFNVGRLNDSLIILSKIKEHDNDYEKKLLIESNIYRRMNDSKKALEIIKTAYEKYPLNLDINLSFIESLFRWISKRQAYELLQSVEENFVLEPKTIIQKCSMFRRDGLYSEIRTILANSLEQFKKHQSLINHLFLELLNKGLFDEAQCLLIESQKESIFNNESLSMLRGKFSFMLWKIDEAYQYYLEAERQSKPSKRYYHETMTSALLSFAIDEANQIQLDRCNDKTQAIKNPTQSIHGQILNEFLLEKELCAHLRKSLIASDTEALRNIVLEYSHNLASSIAWLVHLRKLGLFSQTFKPSLQKIPHNIIRFWDTSTIPEDIIELMQTWEDYHSGWNIYTFDDSSAKSFIMEHFGASLTQVYRHAKSPANKSDIFRLAALYVLGGVYADADDRCLGNVSDIIRHYDFVGYQEHFGSSGNNFLAISPSHPIVKYALDSLIEDYENGSTESVWLSSGPGLMSRSLSRYLAENFDSFKNGEIDIILYNVFELYHTVAFHCFAHYKTTDLHWTKSEFKS